MDSDSPVSNKTYIKVVKALHALFAKSYRDGGWLPGGREMAKELGVSYMTYNKAITCMIRESFVKSYPNIGYYVIPDCACCHKIGVILGDGSESPFIEMCDSFINGIKYLQDNGFDVQIIQGSHIAQLHDNIIAHGVVGVLWLKPPASAASCIQKIKISGEVPLVVVQWGDSVFDCEACCVRYDNMAIGRAQAEVMLKRGHRQLVISGNPTSEMIYGVIPFLNEAGINTENNIFPDVADNPEGFRTLLKKHKCTGIISSGGVLNLNAVFNVAASLPVAERPEIMIYGLGQPAINAISQKGIKFLIMNPQNSLGETAAQLLTEHIQTKKALVNVNVGAINRLSGTALEPAIISSTIEPT